MKETVQHFTKEHLKECSKMKPDHIIKFLYDYRKMLIIPGDLVQVNIRVPKNVLKLSKEKPKEKIFSTKKRLRN